jgi:small ligand-binding sensory domain FIST
MTEFSTGFSRAPSAEIAAQELISQVELALCGADQVGGGLLFATVASGQGGPEIGRHLLARWPSASLVGTSFEGVLAEGQVWRDRPAAGLIAWKHGIEEPLPVVLDAAGVEVEHVVHELLEAAGRVSFGPQDLLLLFPDAMASSRLESLLCELLGGLGRPSLAGAAASGVAGSACLAWVAGEDQPAATVGLLVPGGAEPGQPRVQRAGGSRFASPWLEISACRERWVDGLDGEPPLDWVRRQLGLEERAPIEPYLDRLLVRLRDVSVEHAAIQQRLVGRVGSDEAAEDRGDFVERYVVGLDERRGSISVPGTLRRGGHLALALPDADRARVALRSAVRNLAPSPLLLQFACRARDEMLHGDPDLESALVAHDAGGRPTLGTMAPFQLCSNVDGPPLYRMLVHSNVLAALGNV